MHISTMTLFAVVAAMSVMTAVEAVLTTETGQVRHLSQDDFRPTSEELKTNKRVVTPKEVLEDMYLSGKMRSTLRHEGDGFGRGSSHVGANWRTFEEQMIFDERTQQARVVPLNEAPEDLHLSDEMRSTLRHEGDGFGRGSSHAGANWRTVQGRTKQSRVVTLKEVPEDLHLSDEMRSTLRHERNELERAGKRVGANRKTLEWIKKLVIAAWKCIMRDKVWHRHGIPKALLIKCGTSVKETAKSLGERPSSLSHPSYEPTFLPDETGGGRPIYDIVKAIIGEDLAPLLKRAREDTEDAHHLSLPLQAKAAAVIKDHQLKPSESGSARLGNLRTDRKLIADIFNFHNKYGVGSVDETVKRIERIEGKAHTYFKFRA